jgi:ABC-2 type transport system ATP-binding protein
MIEIQALTKAFGPFVAVDEISFTVRPGEVLGFLGPNGAGKSTTMKMITGFLTPTAGRVRIFGHDIAREALKAQRLTGYLPEGAPAYGDMTPRQFLNFIAEVRGFRGAEKGRRVEEAVRDVHLEEVLHQPIDTLSKGYKRRVGLAQAILHRPPVLILDEPTDGLDPNQKHEVRQLIERMSAERIIIVSTHILEEVTALCSRAMIIARGRVVADATPAELEAASSYHGAVTVQLERFEAAAAGLRGQAAVRAVAVDPAVGAVTIFPEGGADVLPLIERMVAEQQWPVRQIYRERGRLDDVFRRITQEARA